MKIVNFLIILYIFLQPNIAVSGAARIIDADAVRNNTTGVISFIVPTALPTASRVCVFDGANTLAAATATVTELGFIVGVTSSIQTQLNSKAVYPSQTGNNGKFLQTDGSSTSWQTVTTNPGTVTNVTATSPLSVTSPSTTPNISIQNADSTHTGALLFGDWIIFNGKQAAGNYITSLTGDVSASGPGSSTATVNSVGGSTASAINTGTIASNNATASATSNTIVKRDGSANFSAGTITANTVGNQTGTIDAVSTATVVAGAQAANAASTAVTSNTIAKRDGFAQLSASTFIGNLNGNASGTAANVTGIVAIANGGSGQSGQQAAINALTNVAGHTDGDVLQLLSGNAQFGPYTPPSPVGTANTPSYYDSSGVLGAIPGWLISPDFFGPNANLSYSAIDGQNTNFQEFTYNSGMSVNSPTSNFSGTVETMNHDSAASVFNINNVYLKRMELRLNGNGLTNFSSGLQFRHLLGNGSTTGTLQDGSGIDNYMNIGAGFSVLGTYNLFSNSATIDGTIENFYLSNNYINGLGPISNGNGISLGFQTPVTNNLTLMNLNSNASVGGNYNGIFVASDNAVAGNSNLIGANSTSPVAGNLTMWNSYISPSGTIAGDFRQGQWGNDATIGGFGAGLLNNQTGAVTKGYTHYGAYSSGNIGDGSGVNAIAYDSSFQGGTINGGLFGFNLFNTMNILGNNNIQLFNGSNQGSGHSISGFGFFNNANMTEEIKGGTINSTGNARTQTGLDINLSGVTTNDGRGLRVDVSNLTSPSTANHVHSAELTGGQFSVEGLLTPFNNVGVDTGNGLRTTTEIMSGSPVVGTDLIQTLVQSNLLLHDTIAMGPFGLGVNSNAIVPQIALDPGIVLPYHRTMLLGTSVPQGSGGTITDGVDLELLGYPSFGGSLAVTNLVAVQDAQALGQNFCDYATNCWFLRVRDNAAENELPKLSINTASQKVTPGVRLEVNGNVKIDNGHLISTQTVPPGATALDGGTGSTASVSNATDVAGLLIFNATGVGASSGPQVSVDFSSAYTSAPICVISPTNGNSSGEAVTRLVQVSSDAAHMYITFGNPVVGPTVYTWTYHCVETQP